MGESAGVQGRSAPAGSVADEGGGQGDGDEGDRDEQCARAVECVVPTCPTVSLFSLRLQVYPSPAAGATVVAFTNVSTSERSSGAPNLELDGLRRRFSHSSSPEQRSRTQKLSIRIYHGPRGSIVVGCLASAEAFTVVPHVAPGCRCPAAAPAEANLVIGTAVTGVVAAPASSRRVAGQPAESKETKDFRASLMNMESLSGLSEMKLELEEGFARDARLACGRSTSRRTARSNGKRHSSPGHLPCPCFIPVLTARVRSRVLQGTTTRRRRFSSGSCPTSSRSSTRSRRLPRPRTRPVYAGVMARIQRARVRRRAR